MTLKPGYQVNHDARNCVIRLTFDGFWDEATADAFAVDLRTAMDHLREGGCRQGSFLYLADFRKSSIQSAVIVERFQGFAATAGVQARRIAVLVNSVLQRKQTQRMAEGYEHYRFFLDADEEAAEEWLIRVDTAVLPDE